MEILVVGGTGVLVSSLVTKLSKEGNRVHVLTGQKKVDDDAKPKAFQIYNYSYDSEVISEVVESVNPELVIFTGAYDTNFTKGRNRHDAVLFQAGLQNLLMAASALRHCRFIYLSSEKVVAPNSGELIKEDVPASAPDDWNLSIGVGEEVCLRYENARNLDVTVLRLDHLYYTPKKLDDISEDIGFMCVEALNTGKIEASKFKKLSMMYVDDAVEYIVQTVKNPYLKWSVYNVSTSEVTDANSLAYLVAGVFEKNSIHIDVVSPTADSEIGAAEQKLSTVLDGSTFRKEINHFVRYPYEKMVEQVVKYIIKHRRRFISDPKEKTSGIWAKVKKFLIAIIPYVENVICFIPFFMLNNRSVGSSFFERVDFYLLYVLLFAVVYGQQQATLSGILAVLGYIFRQAYTRSGFDILLDYNTYVWIAQLFIVGLIVGYMRDRLTTLEADRRQEVDFLSYQLTDVQGINDSNIQMKNVLENQLVSQEDSLGKLFEITQSLEKYAPEEVLFYAAEVVARIVETEDVAIYTVANKSFARLFSSTSEKSRSLGNSVDYTKLEGLYDDILNRRVYINRKLEEGMPHMASAIYSENDMQLIVMVWGIPWERMTLGQANMLTITGSLIQNAVVRANRYLEVLEKERYIDGTKVLEMDAFSTLVQAYLTAGAKGLTECTLIRLRTKETTEALPIDAELASKHMRVSDYMGILEEHSLFALLANTGAKDADFVLKRFIEAGFTEAQTVDADALIKVDGEN